MVKKMMFFCTLVAAVVSLAVGELSLRQEVEKESYAFPINPTFSPAVDELSWRQEVYRDCPFKCKCEPRPKHETHVTCRGDGLGLNYVPSPPQTTARLDMNHNNLPHITQATFTNVNTPRVRWLKMRNCSIAIIDENAFENTPFEKHVRHLDLSHNALTDTKTLIIFLKRWKELIYLDVTHNPCIDCLELKRGLGHIVNIQCDAPRISCETTTTEVTPPDTTPMIPLNPTPRHVSVDDNPYNDTTPSPVVDIPNPTSPDTQTPVTNDPNAPPEWKTEESMMVGIIVLGCIAVIACVLFLMVRKLSTQTETDDLEGGLHQDLINHFFYENMGSINE